MPLPRPEVHSTPAPPAALAPSEDRPSGAADIRRKAESRRDPETTSGTIEDKLASPKETGKTEAAPAGPPAASSAPASVAEAQKDKDARGAAMPRPLEPVSVERAARLAPAVEGRRDSAAEKATRAPAQAPVAPRAAMSVLPAADVLGRLTVKDRAAAETALIELLTRAGGGLVSRQEEPDATVMGLVVPRASYAEFSHGLERIGAWLPEGEPALLPPDVRVTLRLAR